MSAEVKIRILSSRLPAWYFEKYSASANNLIACYPPGGICIGAWVALREIAPIESVCGPFYVIREVAK